MARAKSAEQSRQRVKPTLVEELSRGIDKLRELSTQIDDLSRDGFPYGDAVRSRTELSLRETIRRLFGEKSPEYQAHRQHVLRVGTQAESSESLALLKELIGRLERQKAELLGLTPDVAPLPPASPPADSRHSHVGRSAFDSQHADGGNTILLSTPLIRSSFQSRHTATRADGQTGSVTSPPIVQRSTTCAPTSCRA